MKEINYNENIDINSKIIKLKENKNEKIDNYIVCIYDVKNINKETQIINYLNLDKKKELEKYSNNPINTYLINEEEIKNVCELYYYNYIKINFNFNYKFRYFGENIIKIKCKNPLKNMIYLFYNCDTLKYLDLSNFFSNNIINMSYMFYNCSSLTTLNLSNFNTNNVNNMSNMFDNCSSLNILNLSNFNTNNFNDMSDKFFGIKKNCVILCNDTKIKKIKI